MDIKLLVGLAGVLALAISAGIITTAFSTYLFNVTKELFDKNGTPTSVGPTLTYKGEHAEEMQRVLQLVPHRLEFWYWTGNLPTVILLSLVVVGGASGYLQVIGDFVYFSDWPTVVKKIMKALPSFCVTLLLFYICFIGYNLLRLNKQFATLKTA